MAYYNTCPRCGSNLDPGEKCDCEKEDKQKTEYILQHIEVSKETGQLSFVWNGREA